MGSISGSVQKLEFVQVNATQETQKQLEEKLDNHPSGLKNSLTLGGANARHFAELASLYQLGALHYRHLVAFKEANLKLYLKSRENLPLN